MPATEESNPVDRAADDLDVKCRRIAVQPHRWQFSLRSLISIVTLAAVLSACAGWLGGRSTAVILFGLGYAGPISWVVAKRATFGLRRRLRASPLERIHVAVSWAGIECGILLSGAILSWVAWERVGRVSWTPTTELAFSGAGLILAATVLLAAYCGLAALLFVLPIAGMLVLISSRGLRTRFEKPLSSLLGGIVGAIWWVIVPWEAFKAMSGVFVGIIATTSVAVPPLLIWLADRRFPADAFRPVSRETWRTFDL